MICSFRRRSRARGGRNIPLKANTDQALKRCPGDVRVLMFRHARTDVAFDPSRDRDANQLMADASADCPPEPMNAEDPLFILYTSGSTGKPKGVLHTTGGYLVYVALTHEYVFDYHDGDVYWCTADVGWVTDQIGPNILLFNTDYPHVEGGRRPFERFETSLGDRSEEIRRKFYADNFVDLMGEGLPSVLRR